MASPEPRPARCTVCHAIYAGDERFCPVDGGAVVPEAVAPDPRIGMVIDGRYVVRRRIAGGGMGTVYEAEHVGLAKSIAIKFMADDATDRDALARFRREARIASRIDHAHVVRIHDVGGVDDASFIVMELVQGRDLEDLLRGGRLTAERAVAIARQVLDGLSAIHAEGIVHRDIKPSNIMLTERDGNADFVKIMDFGISRDTSGSIGTTTKTGQIVGTPQFMAPEQIAGAEIDLRADLYAVGVTLYAMLTGKTPFVHTAFTNLAAAHLLDAPPPLLQARPDCPPALAAAVMRALEKRPVDRFDDARAFAAALTGGSASPPSGTAATVRDRPVTGAPPRRRSRWWLVAIGVSAAAVAVAGGLALHSGKEAAPAAAPPSDGAVLQLPVTFTPDDGVPRLPVDAAAPPPDAAPAHPGPHHSSKPEDNNDNLRGAKPVNPYLERCTPALRAVHAPCIEQ